MNLTIQLSPSAQRAIEIEASARNISQEQAASYIIDTYFTIHGISEEGYDDWFRAKVEEGLEAARNGDFVSDEELRDRMKARRARLLEQIESQK